MREKLLRLPEIVRPLVPKVVVSRLHLRLQVSGVVGVGDEREYLFDETVHKVGFRHGGRRESR